MKILTQLKKSVSRGFWDEKRRKYLQIEVSENDHVSSLLTQTYNKSYPGSSGGINFASQYLHRGRSNDSNKKRMEMSVGIFTIRMFVKLSTSVNEVLRFVTEGVRNMKFTKNF
jgi:hypothetical protein